MALHSIWQRVKAVFRRPSGGQQREDEGDGTGVLVGVGPRPLRGGAQAKPPQHVVEESSEQARH
ncbi:hypothetical protein [Deinococcus sp. QL22]|uniref:hypothetical protein n=1 Tax=Deinococcus sp. QL22 TaxID=2939437 RepID=UPI00201717D3|nr:hypothetical protein [Deinococcus sp. QL22]UQN07130.1 hypothetical protein M1R55_04245 [Deinococcus sp. QL22]